MFKIPLSKKCVTWSLVILFLSGCDAVVLNFSGMAETHERRILETVRAPSGLVGRCVVKYPAGNCIILHYPLREDFEIDLTRVLEGDPGTKEDDGELLGDQRDSWVVAAAETPAMFNCCTYAVGDAAGLSPRDWIEPYASGHTYFTQPMQVILDSFFRMIRTYHAPLDDWHEIAADESLQPGDVLCFWVAESPRNSPEAKFPEIVHAGKIHKKNGQNWLISKINVGPLVLAPIRSTSAQFDYRFDEIRVYRAK